MPRKTALFVTCLVDQFFPQVGEAAVRLLERCGREVSVPLAQTCCGQPAMNSGYRAEARTLLRRFVEIFEGYDEVVAPSGSCVSMVRVHGAELFAGEPRWKERAEALASRVFELTEFLHREGFEPDAPFPGKVTYHASCHLLRELGLANEPRELLSKVPGAEVVELPKAEDCCGFGGVFSVKMPELSVSMMNAKLQAAEGAGADVLTATDCGCLMHLGGALARRGSRLRTLHIAEILAGEARPVP